MSTTAILTYASRLSIQAYDTTGVNLTGLLVNLQVRKISPKKMTPKIPMTNSESPARQVEFAPGNQTGEWSIEGICDQPGNWDQLWTTISDGALFAAVTYYVAKAAIVANPLTYVAKTLFTECSLEAEITEEGGILKFTANGSTIGGFQKANALTAVAYVTGL